MQIYIELPEDVKRIIKVFNKNGYEAYAVGGCIRDSIINRDVNDWDITTNAKPEIIMSLFEKTIPTGLKHGTITVIINNKQYEVTTYRIEGEYLDNRHPSSVKFVNKIKLDLARRDFTINAMAYSGDNFVDYYEGISDLNNKIIRTVKDPYKRFSEDALRMMRAVRFATQLGFTIEDETRMAIINLADNIKNVSIERITDEFNKIILADIRGVVELKKLGILNVFLPELDKILGENFKKIIEINNVERKLEVRLACLSCLDEGLSNIFKYMKYDKSTLKFIDFCIENINNEINDKYEIKRILNRSSIKMFNEYIKVKQFIDGNMHKKLTIFVNEIQDKDECYSLKQLKISGNDLINLGISGKHIGIILNRLLDEVMKDELNNDKTVLINYAKLLI